MRSFYDKSDIYVFIYMYKPLPKRKEWTASLFTFLLGDRIFERGPTVILNQSTSLILNSEEYFKYRYMIFVLDQNGSEFVFIGKYGQ